MNGRIGILTGESKMLAKLENYTIPNTLIDTAILDPSSIYEASMSVFEVKDMMGIPSGCSPYKVVSRWKRMQNSGRDVYISSAVSSNMIPVNFGKFNLYRSTEHSSSVFHSCAMLGANIAYYSSRYMKMKNVKPEHPLFKIFT